MQCPISIWDWPSTVWKLRLQNIELLIINCNELEAAENRENVNEQSQQDKSKTNKNSKLNPSINSKLSRKWIIFLQGEKKKLKWWPVKK